VNLAIAVTLAAGVGAMARYLVDQIVQHQHDRAFPWGTFLINVSGTFLLGLSTALAAHHGLSPHVAAVIGIGFCGGFTTWSTYCWETLALAETGSLGPAALNVVGSLLVGFAAAAAGLALGSV
jgi:CrcB protein